MNTFTSTNHAILLRGAQKLMGRSADLAKAVTTTPESSSPYPPGYAPPVSSHICMRWIPSDDGKFRCVECQKPIEDRPPRPKGQYDHITAPDLAHIKSGISPTVPAALTKSGFKSPDEVKGAFD